MAGSGTGATATVAEASAPPTGCGERQGSAKATSPSTPLPPATSTVVKTPTSELREGDAVEAQFLLADQGVWTTSWYRGKVSQVNRVGEGAAVRGVTGEDEGSAAAGAREEVGDGDDCGSGHGGAVTYGVEFVDGDHLDEVPEAHIRLFRGLKVKRKLRGWSTVFIVECMMRRVFLCCLFVLRVRSSVHGNFLLHTVLRIRRMWRLH